jgi:hypothetical protein
LQTAVEVLEDEGLFEEEDEEDAGALAMYVFFLPSAVLILVYLTTVFSYTVAISPTRSAKTTSGCAS